MFKLLFVCLLLLIFHTNLFIYSITVETLHFESACLRQSNSVHLHLQCSHFEHIQIIRIIYGYTKQTTLKNQCQFSIYDCIQEGASRSILTCNGQQTCSIHLNKNEMLSSTITTHGVPSCKDFNYVQVNFGCVPDAKDVCESWKEEAPIIYLSHTRSYDQQYRRCHCKIRSSISNGQVLLHAREMNREFASLKKQFQNNPSSKIDCKKTTYLEIATDRSERKCMDMLPSNGNALFGSGTHNFSLTYVRNDDNAELFFFFELKASPMKKDHNVQIICNWARRTTTMRTTTTSRTTTIPIDLTTSSIIRRIKQTTMSMQRGGKLSRLDLIRHHPPTSEDNLPEIEVQEEEEEQEQEQQPSIDIDETTTLTNEIEEDSMTTTSNLNQLSKRKKKKKNNIKNNNNNNKSTTSIVESSTTTMETTTSSSVSDDEEWLRILSLAAVDSPPSKQLFSLNNRTFLTATQASLVNNERNSFSSSSSSLSSSNNILLIILLVGICVTLLALIIYCLRVKRPDCLRRLMMNSNVALLFCCEAGKLLFCSTTTTSMHGRQQTRSITSTTPASTFAQRHRRHRPSSPPMLDYQSSEYYMDGLDHGRTTQSIYDRAGGKSIYSIEDDDERQEEEEETEYTTKYDRHNAGDSC